MKVFFDEQTGVVTHTMRGASEFCITGNNYITVDKMPEGHLSCWKVENGQLVSSEDLSGAYAALRLERNMRLDACEWTQNADNQLSEEKRAEWRAYRQALREFPKTVEDPVNPVWPIEPE